ncbi:MAG: GGDEF domain-containing protein [Candidatus Nanopelagicaceae bacterium]|nr:GGDEF domain-containing protein [Candidatus Nanopelagicaceae bacterium]
MRLLVRGACIGFLAAHAIERIISPQPSFFWDLLIYNLIVFALAVTLLVEAEVLLSVGFACWGLSSTTSSWFALNNVAAAPVILDLGYVLFFPFLIIHFLKFSDSSPKSKIQFLDAAIIALGISSFLTAFALEPISDLQSTISLRNLLNNFYPISDVILCALVITIFSKHKISLVNVLQGFGFLAFTLTDIKFFWISANEEYSLGSWIESGWIFALILISLHEDRVSKRESENQLFNQKMIFFSIFLSFLTLGLLTIWSDSLSKFAVIPAVLALIMAFLRMSIALKHSQNLDEEHKLARTDELTGIANRRSLLAKLNDAEFGPTHCMLLLDLDSFKEINDDFGHDAGDAVLREVARRFEQVLPSNAFLARLGGDEFGVLVQADFQQAAEISKRLELSLTSPIYVDQVPRYLSVSIGVAEKTVGIDLIRAADEAMYIAKSAR